jgi:general secretion pathway protein D
MVDTAARFTDLSRQNGVIVHSNSDDVLDRVDYWRKQLDTPEATEDRQYFMYYPENMEAAKLADVLEKLVKVADGGSRATGSAASSAEDSDTGSGARATGSRASRGSSGRSDDFSFVTDENRNVIIIYATGSKYKSVLPLLQKLDVTPPQVLIEAKLIEVTLTDQLSQGIEWSMFGGGAKRDMATSQLSSFANGSFSYTISGVDYDVALSLLQNQDRLKVLSSPRIVVANGEKASINVGTEIPVLATQSADVDTDRVLQSIQYRSTGVDLTVEPTVNSSNVISLIISQNVSETSENASSGLDSPIILNRSFKTTVVANSGQALVLGGLIRENNSSKDAQVPFLGDIPGLGKLFSNESRSKSRTELVVLITPRIISNSSDIDDIKRLFIEEFTLMEAGATTATP